MNVRRSLGGPISVGLMVALAAGPGASQVVLDRTAQERNFSAVAAVVTAQVTERPTAAEGARLALVERYLANRRNRAEYLRVRGVRPTTRRDAAVAALRRNLSLSIASAEPGRGDTLLKEAEAVFDPVLDLQVGYTRGDTYTRQKIGLVEEQFFLTVAGLGNSDPGEVIDNDPIVNFSGDPAAVPGRRFNLCKPEPRACETTEPVIRAIEFYQDLSRDIVEDEITASGGRANSGHPDQQVSVQIGLEQALPWGGSVSVIDQTLWQKIFYNSNDDAWQEDGAWTTNITLQLNQPVPFTKGFGEWNPDNAAIRTAEALRERTDWVLKQALQETLRDVDLAFFDVASSLESLDSAMRNQRLVRRLRDRMNRLFEAGEGTRYQKAQLDNEYTRATIRVEQAFQAYVNASITLAGIMGDPDVQAGDVLYLPYAYTPELTDTRRVDARRAVAIATRNRPEVFIAQLDRKTAEISLNLARNQALPDIQVSGSVALTQDGSVFGYEHPMHSHGRIFDPDVINQSYSITYTYPWLNRAPEATVARTRSTLDLQELGFESTVLQVRREVNQSLASLQSARAQVPLARDEVVRRRSAYDSLVRQQDVGIVSEDELVTASTQLLAAELSLIDARIGAKQAETNLLFSQGVLAAEMPVETAQTELEKRRLERLADAGMLAYFGPTGSGQRQGSRRRP